MFEIDKAQFGRFISELRVGKGYTQKELAERLFVSDKAVSKWERGLSLPDVSLLVPLADILDADVTELLEGRRIEKAAELDRGQVEALVKKTISFSETNPERSRAGRKKNALIYVLSILLVAAEAAVYSLLGYGWEAFWRSSIIVYLLLGLVFGAYFWLFVPERLPAYYDDNKISSFSDGIFRMNMMGVCFNNSNWPYIVRAGRWWSVLSLVLMPLIWFVFSRFFPVFWEYAGLYILLAVVLGGLFIPIYVFGKKYQ